MSIQKETEKGCTLRQNNPPTQRLMGAAFSILFAEHHGHTHPAPPGVQSVAAEPASWQGGQVSFPQQGTALAGPRQTAEAPTDSPILAPSPYPVLVLSNLLHLESLGALALSHLPRHLSRKRQEGTGCCRKLTSHGTEASLCSWCSFHSGFKRVAAYLGSLCCCVVISDCWPVPAGQRCSSPAPIQRTARAETALAPKKGDSE